MNVYADRKRTNATANIYCMNCLHQIRYEIGK